MDVEPPSRAPAAFRETCRAAALALGVIFGPLLCVIFAIASTEVDSVRVAFGICAGTYAIRWLVRRINRHDDPPHAKRLRDNS
jgi:hypothetical protein